MTRRGRLRLAAVLLSTAAALALAELAARLAYGEGFASLVDPHEFHAYRPYARTSASVAGRTVVVQTNSLGWKDSAPRRIALDPAPEKRVVFLGDSFTEGLGLPQEETLTAVVAERLVPAGFEVLNGGRLSHSPLLEYQRLKHFLARGNRADVVVVLPDVSDVQDELFYAEQFVWSPGGEPLHIEGALFHPLVRPLFNRLALARWVRRAWERLFPAAPEDRHPAELPAPGPGPAGPLPRGGTLSRAEYERLSPSAKIALRANWMGHPPSVRGWAGEGMDAIGASLLRIQGLARQHGMRLIVALYPWPQMLYTERDPAYYRLLRQRFGRWYRDREQVYGRDPSPRRSAWECRLEALCRQHGIELIDLVPAFHRVEAWHELYLRGDVHFSPAGHRLVGEALAAAILDGGAGAEAGLALLPEAEPPPAPASRTALKGEEHRPK